jgi:glycosyltransferase involved in cell wall biosynthesis
MKTLTLVQADMAKPRDAELEMLEASDQCPRISLFEKTLGTVIIDEGVLDQDSPVRRSLYRLLPISAAQVLEAFRLRNDVDAIISWAEHLGLPLAVMLKLSFSRTPHIGMYSWISKPKKAFVLRLIRSHLHRLILMSSAQYEFAVNMAGMDPRRTTLLRWPVDLKYWRPMDGAHDRICSVGREMRDYGTLVEALRGWQVPCHIAANAFAGKRDRWIDDIERARPLPPWITIGSLGYVGLRDLYAHSRFMVCPLYPTDTDNGTTAILEAMAMGKPVICSRVDGQRDVIEDGVTGVLVPPQNPGALREAMEYLWNRPDVCRTMGAAARVRVEKMNSYDAWVLDVRKIVEGAVLETDRSPSGRP